MARSNGVKKPFCWKGLEARREIRAANETLSICSAKFALAWRRRRRTGAAEVTENGVCTVPKHDLSLYGLPGLPTARWTAVGCAPVVVAVYGGQPSSLSNSPHSTTVLFSGG